MALATGETHAEPERHARSAAQRPRDRLTLALGAILIVLVVLSVQAALGLVFDPRYRDFPFAPLTGAVVPLLLIARGRRGCGRRVRRPRPRWR